MIELVKTYKTMYSFIRRFRSFDKVNYVYCFLHQLYLTVPLGCLLILVIYFPLGRLL